MQLYHRNETYVEVLDALIREMDEIQSSLMARSKRRLPPLAFDPPARSTVSAFVDQFVNLLVSR